MDDDLKCPRSDRDDGQHSWVREEVDDGSVDLVRCGRCYELRPSPLFVTLRGALTTHA